MLWVLFLILRAAVILHYSVRLVLWSCFLSLAVAIAEYFGIRGSFPLFISSPSSKMGVCNIQYAARWAPFLPLAEDLLKPQRMGFNNSARIFFC